MDDLLVRGEERAVNPASGPKPLPLTLVITQLHLPQHRPSLTYCSLGNQHPDMDTHTYTHMSDTTHTLLLNSFHSLNG